MEIELRRAVGLLDYLGKLAWLEGEEIIITNRGKPYLRLLAHPEGSPPDKPGRNRGIGLGQGEIWTAPDLPETSEEIIEAFEGKWSNDFF